MSHQDEIDQAVSAHAAEKAQRAFFKVATMRTETEQMIFEAKSRAFELNQNEHIWQIEWDELMMAECMRLTKGDELKAKLLLSLVMYGEDE